MERKKNEIPIQVGDKLIEITSNAKDTTRRSNSKLASC